jgi:hypothetical protein
LQKCGKDAEAATLQENVTATLFKFHQKAKGKGMKALRALVLTLAVSVCAYAGDMPNGIAESAPVSVAGDMPNGVANQITEITITLIQSVLSLI